MGSAVDQRAYRGFERGCVKLWVTLIIVPPRPLRPVISESLYYAWPKEFLEAGKHRLAGDTERQAISPEIKELRSLYCCSDGMRGRGAAVTNLAHNASLQSNERITPSNRGIKWPASDAPRPSSVKRQVMRPSETMVGPDGLAGV